MGQIKDLMIQAEEGSEQAKHLLRAVQRVPLVPAFRINIAPPIAARPDDQWVPACGGTEVPFKTRSGKTLHYLWNRTTGEHAYYDVQADLFLTKDEAQAALNMQ